MRPKSRNILVLLTAGPMVFLVGLSLLMATGLPPAQPGFETSEMLPKESASPEDFTRHRPTNSGSEPNVQEVGSTISVTVTVTTLTTVIPDRFSLSQNYPNPFNQTTMIEYDLPVPTHVTIDIYNMLGQKVRTLVDDNRAAGSYRVMWDGNTSSGRICIAYKPAVLSKQRRCCY